MKSLIGDNVSIDSSEHKSLDSSDAQVYCVNLYRLHSIKPRKSEHSRHSYVISNPDLGGGLRIPCCTPFKLLGFFLLLIFLLMSPGRRIQEVWSLLPRLWPLFPVVSLPPTLPPRRKKEVRSNWPNNRGYSTLSTLSEQGHFHTD